MASFQVALFTVSRIGLGPNVIRELRGLFPSSHPQDLPLLPKTSHGEEPGATSQGTVRRARPEASSKPALTLTYHDHRGVGRGRGEELPVQVLRPLRQPLHLGHRQQHGGVNPGSKLSLPKSGSLNLLDFKHAQEFCYHFMRVSEMRRPPNVVPFFSYNYFPNTEHTKLLVAFN